MKKTDKMLKPRYHKPKLYTKIKHRRNPNTNCLHSCFIEVLLPGNLFYFHVHNKEKVPNLTTKGPAVLQ